MPLSLNEQRLFSCFVMNCAIDRRLKCNRVIFRPWPYTSGVQLHVNPCSRIGKLPIPLLHILQLLEWIEQCPRNLLQAFTGEGPPSKPLFIGSRNLIKCAINRDYYTSCDEQPVCPPRMNFAQCNIFAINCFNLLGFCRFDLPNVYFYYPLLPLIQ